MRSACAFLHLGDLSRRTCSRVWLRTSITPRRIVDSANSHRPRTVSPTYNYFCLVTQLYDWHVRAVSLGYSNNCRYEAIWVQRQTCSPAVCPSVTLFYRPYKHHATSVPVSGHTTIVSVTTKRCGEILKAVQDKKIKPKRNYKSGIYIHRVPKTSTFYFLNNSVKN